jgi:PIN domain nuclease of toxin-antitoxin system
MKRHAGKLLIDEDPHTIVRSIRSQEAWHILPLEVEHFHALNDLPAFEDHTDPFDRLLIAQAVTEQLGVVTSDRHFRRYDVQVLW